MFFVISCVTFENQWEKLNKKLSEQERKVRVTSDPNAVTGCRFIKQVTQKGHSFFGRLDWEGELKKASAKVGGNIVLFDQMIEPYVGIIFRGEIYHCE